MGLSRAIDYKESSKLIIESPFVVVFHYAYLLLFPICNGLLVENLRFFAVLLTPVSFEALARELLRDLGYENWYQKLESLGYRVVKTASLC